MQFVLDVAFVERCGSRREAWRRISTALQWVRARLRDQLCVDIAVSAVVYLADQYPFEGYRLDFLNAMCNYFQTATELPRAGLHDLVGDKVCVLVLRWNTGVVPSPEQIVLVTGLKPVSTIGLCIYGSVCRTYGCAVVYDLFASALQLPYTLLHGNAVKPEINGCRHVVHTNSDWPCDGNERRP